MRLLPAQVGAEPKKLAILGAIVVVAGVVYWMNRTPSSEALADVATRTAADPMALKRVPDSTSRGPETAAKSPAISRSPVPERDTSPMPAKRSSKGGGSATESVEDFRPTLKPKDGVDVTRIDPTLHLDLLAKVREVPMEGGSRNLFEYSQPPAPPPPKVEPIVVPPPVVTKVVPPVPTKPVDPPKPAPPAIPLKYYGLAGTVREGKQRGLFLEGDPATAEPIIAAENETIKDRYKIVRFGVNSVVVEDTSSKNQQTLPMLKEADQ